LAFPARINEVPFRFCIHQEQDTESATSQTIRTFPKNY
jgi:hypothetical protein